MAEVDCSKIDGRIPGGILQSRTQWALQRGRNTWTTLKPLSENVALSDIAVVSIPDSSTNPFLPPTSPLGGPHSVIGPGGRGSSVLNPPGSGGRTPSSKGAKNDTGLPTGAIVAIVLAVVVVVVVLFCICCVCRSEGGSEEQEVGGATTYGAAGGLQTPGAGPSFGVLPAPSSRGTGGGMPPTFGPIPGMGGGSGGGQMGGAMPMSGGGPGLFGPMPGAGQGAGFSAAFGMDADAGPSEYGSVVGA